MRREGTKVTERRKDRVSNARCYTIPGEGHTLGRILQHQLLKNEKVLFAGYRVPHPSKNEVELEVQTRGPEFTPRDALNESLAEAGSQLEQLKTRFEELVRRPVGQRRDKITLKLEGVSIEIANGLRRSMYSEVATLAIDLVNFSEKNTCKNEKFMGHLLGMVPLQSENVGTLRYSEDCECEGSCGLCSVEFSIDSEKTESGSITTKDLFSSNRNFLPLQSNARIVQISCGDSLKLTAIARKGTGKTNAKWCPVSAVAFQIIPEIVLNPELAKTMTCDQKTKWLASCPFKIFKWCGNSIEIEERYELDCDYCNMCIRAADKMRKHDLVKIKERENDDGTYNFVIRVESTGVLKPETIVREGMDALSKKISMVQSGLNKLSDHGGTHSLHAKPRPLKNLRITIL